jgi:hypothetical protein
MIDVHRVGFNARAPRAVTARIEEFNRGLGAGAALDMTNSDVKEFFTNVPRREMRRVVRKYVDLTLALNGAAPFF